MNKKHFSSGTVFYLRIFYIIIVFFFLNNCGIEDSFYFQEPIDLTVDGSDPKLNIVSFTAYNQEKDSTKYLLIGYEVYYFFGNESSVKKAAVRNPIVNFDLSPITNLINFKNFTPQDSSRFINYDNTFELYKDFTIPVTYEMIDDILYEGNNHNVVFYFHDISFIGDVNPPETNPKIDTAEKGIKIENIYPNYEEYRYYEWGVDSDFKGFYDKDYYDHYDIDEVEITPAGNYVYKINIYVVARGFSSGLYDKDFISSIKSNYQEVWVEVDPATVHP